MTIANQQAYFDSLWDWACLDGCFGGDKERPTDIDGLFEKREWFLLLETKLPTVVLTRGQEIMFTQLVKDKRFCIMIIWGHPGNPIKIEIIRNKSRIVFEKNVDLEFLRSKVKMWYEWACRN